MFIDSECFPVVNFQWIIKSSILACLPLESLYGDLFHSLFLVPLHFLNCLSGHLILLLTIPSIICIISVLVKEYCSVSLNLKHYVSIYGSVFEVLCSSVADVGHTSSRPVASKCGRGMVTETQRPNNKPCSQRKDVGRVP